MNLKLNNKRTILVGLAFLSICAFWQMYNSVIPKILTYTFHLDETYSGIIMAADNVLALFLLPLFGAISDKSRSRMGRRMPFILFGVLLLTACFGSGYVYTLFNNTFHPALYALFALVGVAWASINVNSLPMVVEMCRGSDVGKFTGYYYTASMAAQTITPIVAGWLLKHVSYSVLFLYSAIFVALAFFTMLMVRHGDVKVEAKRGLEAFDVDD